MDRAFRLPLKHDTQQNKIESGIPLAVTYNPAFNNLSTTLRENFNIFTQIWSLERFLRQVH